MSAAPLRRFGGSVLAFAGVVVGGCTYEPTPALPDGALSLTAPPAYVTWWEKTTECSGISGNMARVEWYVVPDVATFSTEQGEKVGIRVKSGDRIQVVLAGQYQMHEMVVRHEMLHALLQEPGHPDEYFTERCRLTWDTWQADHSDVDNTTLAAALN